MSAAATVLIGLAVLTAAAGDAAAHDGGSNGYAAVSIARATVRYQLTLWPATLPAELAVEIARARAGNVTSRDRLLGLFRDKLTVTAQDRRCEAGLGSAVPPHPGTDSLTLVLDFACAEEVRTLRVRDDLFDVFGADYHTLARFDFPDRSVQFAFTPEAREARLTLDGPQAGGILSFVTLGVEHILTGWDHLLFLLVLLLRFEDWRSLVKIVTAFTLAHSVTLALAALDVVTPPDRLVEAVIALSIAVVAAENLFLHPLVGRRWLVSFGFGLVHGFGFSSVLRELGLPTQGLVVALFGFNAGVELGQLLAVAVALPVLLIVRDTRWEPRVIWGSSAAILLVGVVLFLERTLP